MCDSEDALLEDLRRNYTKLGHKLYFAGISQIHHHYRGCLSISKIKEFLLSVYTYTIHKESHENVRNPLFPSMTFAALIREFISKEHKFVVTNELNLYLYQSLLINLVEATFFQFV